MRVIEHDDEKYLNISDYVLHLVTAIGTVEMMTGGAKTVTAKAVVDTLTASMEHLESMIMNDLDGLQNV